MKTALTTAAALIGAAVLASTALAQTDSPGQPLTPNSVIYLPQLPTVAELSHSASAKGQSIASIQQMNGVESVVYHVANDQTNIVEYRTLPGSGAPGAATEYGPPAVSEPQPVYGPATVSGPAPAVVYAPSPNVYYYDSPAPYYYPWGGYPGSYLRLGFGGGGGGRFGFGGGGFGFRGGWRR
jgi:hypothetical protein